MRFLLVDKILKLVPGKSIVATKTMEPDEELFRDHFPGFPVVPGVLLTEMMAQAAGKCLDAEKSPRGRAMLGKISNATFRRWVAPGETAVITAAIDSNREEFATAKCHVEVKDKRVCSADLFFVFVPHGKFAAGHRDEVLEAYLLENRIQDSEPEAS
ncbi:beta-hydroxyacyl-ACP dehydratase [bacterium]|nr:beta-hydroxyacyl-ACP dehydratase [bacterium]